MITIEKSKCVKCKQCIKVCPFTVLQEMDGYPEFNVNKVCIECLHCAAICPEDAIEYDFGSNSNPKCKSIPMPLTEDFANQLTYHIKTRRSIRHFKEEVVSKEVLTDILSTVKMVPSAKNQHPCKWVIVHGKDHTQRVMDMVLSWVSQTGIAPEIQSEYAIGNNIVTMDAPDLLIAYGSESAINSHTDCTIALTSAELLLQAKGIGTCWAGYLTRMSNANPEIIKYLGIPEGNKIYGILAMGYPDGEKYNKIPCRPDSEITWI